MQLEGWTVLVNKRLLEEQKELGQRVLALLKIKLQQVASVVPKPALDHLRKVPIWIDLTASKGSRVEYHPSRKWLQQHGRNPLKAKCVEIGNPQFFLKFATTDQPMMVLHELAHAYHDQVLGFQNAEIAAAYERALRSGKYNKVKHISGKQQRAYALNNPKEFFAEMSEAYFGRNDFFPFTKEELKQYDPKTFELIAKCWHSPQKIIHSKKAR